ncbi:MAG TPA: hypothetical protein VIH53_12825, partial [Gemmatimonadaceae bacterium]
MAQLDRFLNLLVTNNGTALVLTEGEIATVTIKDSARPVMKQSLTSTQILTLVREIAPQNQPHALDAAGNVRFEYASADGNFEVSMTQNGKIAARIEPRAAGAPKSNPTPAQAATPSPATAPARTAPPRPEPIVTQASNTSAGGNRALDRMENL